MESSGRGKEVYNEIRKQYHKVIVGQEDMLMKVLVSLFSGGHVLLEGVPGLAKTETMKVIAKITGLDFSRIQFTPDLLPADILGTQIFNQQTNTFEVKKGRLFANLVLADEINRSPSKIQSALLEAMQERQISIGDQTFILDSPYFVIATQNPVDQEGTYKLSEAQVDRFMMRVIIDYPSRDDERLIIQKHFSEQKESIDEILSKKSIEAIKKEIESVYIDEKLINYIVEIVYATRKPEDYGIGSNFISVGASPRASINIMKAAKSYAYLRGESYVTTDDIKSVVFDVLNHRISLRYEAQAEDVSINTIINKILLSVKTP